MNDVCLSEKLSQNSHQGYSVKNGGSYPCLDDFSPEIVLGWPEYKYEVASDRFVARYYDATIGRFISADTIVPEWTNPQSLNRYSYCLNNPLKYIDPSGNAWITPERPEPKITIPPPPPPPEEPTTATPTPPDAYCAPTEIAQMRDMQGGLTTGVVSVDDDYLFMENIYTRNDQIIIHYSFTMTSEGPFENSHIIEMTFGHKYFDMSTLDTYNPFPTQTQSADRVYPINNTFGMFMGYGERDTFTVMAVWDDLHEGQMGSIALTVDRGDNQGYYWDDTLLCEQSEWHMASGGVGYYESVLPLVDVWNPYSVVYPFYYQ